MRAKVLSRFREQFRREANVVVRAPGRVNLIGEHTDYNGLPVLPFAIAQSHYLAFAANDKPRIDIANLDSRYAPKSVAWNEIGTFSGAGEWDNYLRAALLGLLNAGILTREHLSSGLRVMVGSDLSAGVGLSSSSALVVGFALAALEVCHIPFDRLHLAEVMAEAEHYVGTRGGGMDQTVCLLGREGHALRINFYPLEVEAISCGADRRPVHSVGCGADRRSVHLDNLTRNGAVPQSLPLTIFLSDTGVRVEKSGAGRALYNRRPTECRLALEVFKRSVGADLRQVRYWGDLVKPPFEFSHDRVLAMIRDVLTEQQYSAVDLLRRLEIDEATLNRTYLNGIQEAAGTARPLLSEFQLRQRATHVLAEAQRVESAVEALRQGDWARLSELIAASHASCRDLYEISCPEIERHVEAGKAAGALASRLTGAGFGGCVLHLVRRAGAERFEQEMKRQLGESLNLLHVAPSDGAEIQRNNSCE